MITSHENQEFVRAHERPEMQNYFFCNTLWVGENRKIERGRLQLNLASLSIHGSVKCPVESHRTLIMTVQSAMTAQLKPRLCQITTVLHPTYFRKVHQS